MQNQCCSSVSQKAEGPAAWGKLCERFRSYEQPRLQHLIEKLTSHRNKSVETVIEYITRKPSVQIETNWGRSVGTNVQLHSSARFAKRVQIFRNHG